MKRLLILSLLSGCATQGPYWVYSGRAPIEIKEIRFVDYPCGRRLDGCAKLSEGIMELRRGMTAAQIQCVKRHEEQHFAGLDHPSYNEMPHFSTDCGDGTAWITP
jgi:hypothetical protein